MADTWDVAHDTLDRIGCPGSRFKNTAYDRVTLAGDRLMMRPVGEPDTADLVGRINEICDRAGIADGETAWRVQVLADQRPNIEAKPKRSEKVNLALAVIEEWGDGSEWKLAVSVLKEAFA